MLAVKRRAWLFSILTVIFLISAALVMGARVSEAERANGELVPVVVAKTNIAPHSSLTEDLLEIKYIPVKFATENLIRDTAQVLNHSTVAAIKQGDYLTSNLLRSAAAVNPDLRTFSLLSSSKVLIEPSIRPGDRIDILGAYRDRAKDQEIAAVIVPDLEVLGVAIQGKEVLVTLAVKVEHAEMIMRVETFGEQLRVVKRGL